MSCSGRSGGRSPAAITCSSRNIVSRDLGHGVVQRRGDRASAFRHCEYKARALGGASTTGTFSPAPTSRITFPGDHIHALGNPHGALSHAVFRHISGPRRRWVGLVAITSAVRTSSILRRRAISFCCISTDFRLQLWAALAFPLCSSFASCALIFIFLVKLNFSHGASDRRRWRRAPAGEDERGLSRTWRRPAPMPTLTGPVPLCRRHAPRRAELEPDRRAAGLSYELERRLAQLPQAVHRDEARESPDQIEPVVPFLGERLGGRARSAHQGQLRRTRRGRGHGERGTAQLEPPRGRPVASARHTPLAANGSPRLWPRAACMILAACMDI